ncbi:MAG: site-2 protease family protein [Kiritimatiellae bacterium]|nr:site-2 protease family protein [Kiritimatiellia bacterium]
MFPRKLHVCDAFGIPVYLDFSFIVLLVIFMTDFGSFTYGLSFALALAVSVTLHELGHALTARAFGYPTRDITLSLLGGCASLISLPRKAWQEFLTAVAGPAVSFLLSGLCWAALLFLPIENHWVANVLYYSSMMNLMLGGFNLLPGFPMDGGRIFRSIARAFTSRAKATYAAMIVGRVFAVLLGLRGLHSIFTGGAWGFISIMIAWMIWREGWREYQMAVAEESWGGWDFSARVSPPPYGGDSDEAEVRRR